MTKAELLQSAEADIEAADRCVKKAPELEGGSHTSTREAKIALSAKAKAYAAIAAAKIALASMVDPNSAV